MEKLLTSFHNQEVIIVRAPLPANEEARLEALRRHTILDAVGEELLGGLTRLASHICSAPIALISIVESERLCFKSKVGITLTGAEREGSFCSWAILESDLFIVSDVLKDQRFATHPLLGVDPEIRFYAGAPLLTAEGYALGTLAVMGYRPRDLSPFEAEGLRTLAGAVMGQFELNRRSLELEQATADYGHMEDMLRLMDKQLIRCEEENLELSKANALLKEQSDERQQALESLAASEERYALLYRSVSDGLWDWNIKTNEIQYCQRWKAILGYEEDGFGNYLDEWFSRVHPEDIEQVQSDIAAHLLGLTPNLQNEHRVRGRDGSYRWVLIRGLAARDAATKEVYRMAGSMTNITDQKEAEQRLHHSAFQDVLTGLPNRTLFMDRLRRSLARTQYRDDYLFAVLLLDLDRFKTVNDSLGHQVGDQLLEAIARRLEASLRPGDIVARLGDDEFAIIVDHLKQVSDATQAAELIQQELATPFNLNGHQVYASASIGIVLSLTHHELPEDFLRNADTAMYRAKENGRGCFEIFDAGMHARVVAQSQLETDLRWALTRDELRLHYQPIISLDGWRITGFEALLRWEHPQHGYISPLEFIPVAEETGLIISIGEWVLGEACRQLRSWQEQFPSDPPLTISVNLSGKQFSQPDLIKVIEQTLEETGVEAGSLKIEITESAIIENIESATAMLKRLKALGIKVSLDDFGTGYSSLSYLHRFPIDTLKIDRSFVTRMNLPKNSEIIRTIVTLASNLGMDVIAEGVETGEQIIQLTGMNCEYVQGYLLSKPISGEAVIELLEETYHRGLGQHTGTT